MPTLCFIIHGIGSPGADYSGPLTRGIDRQLSKLITGRRKSAGSLWQGIEPGNCVRYLPLYWADVATSTQINLYRQVYPELFVASRAMKMWNTVNRFGFARDLSINLLGDVFSYLGLHHSSIKESVLGDIGKALDEAFRTREPVSLIVVGHSLGTVIIHDLISAFLRFRYADFDALVGHTSVFTLGSPISLFSLVSQSVNPGRFRKWVNFHHKRDLVAFPMRKLPEFSKVEDVGLTWWKWNPLSAHSCYWTNTVVHQRIAQEIIEHRENHVGAVPRVAVTGPPPPDVLQPPSSGHSKVGLAQCHIDYRDVKFGDLIQSAREIDFCNIYGGDWLKRWMPDIQLTLRNSEVRIRACITAPDSPTLQGLAYHFQGMSEETLKEKIAEAQRNVQAAWDDARAKVANPGRIELYFCRNQINHAFYRFDDLLYFTPRPLGSSKHANAPIPCFVYRRTNDPNGIHDWVMRDFEEALKTAHDTTKVLDLKS